MNKTRRLRGDGLGAHTDRDRGRGRLFAVHSALPAEDAALVDDQRADHNVAEDFAGSKDLQAARGVHIALDTAADHDVAATDIAFDPTALADRQVTFGCQVAVHFAIEPD